jgi:MOB kinase activator 1
VACPPGGDADEWVARHAVDFLDAASLLTAAVAQWCTAAACPAMSAGPSREYLWAPPPPPPAPARGWLGKASSAAAAKPARLPAPRYCAALFAWADGLLADPAAFPQAPSAPFPPGFRDAVGPLFKRLARVFAHLYHAHFQHIAGEGRRKRGEEEGK